MTIDLIDPREEDAAAASCILDHYAAKLSAWERTFTDSVLRQLDEGRDLSPRQRAKLGQLFEQVTDGGRR